MKKPKTLSEILADCPFDVFVVIDPETKNFVYDENCGTAIKKAKEKGYKQICMLYREDPKKIYCLGCSIESKDKLVA